MAKEKCLKCKKKLSRKRPTGLCGFCVRKRPLSEQHKKSISQSLHGRIPKNLGMLHLLPRTIQWNSRIGLASKGRPSFLKGKHLPRETCTKISIALTGRKNPKLQGKNNHSWKGGISKKKGYKAFIQLQRTTRKKSNGGSHSFFEWEKLKKKYKNMCLCCKKVEPNIILAQDHIVPISKGGSDNIENIQPLCRSCNSKKRSKIIDYRHA